MDQLVGFLNAAGRAFCQYAGAMFTQTAVLVAVLLVVDLLVRKRARAAFRYWMWMLVFVKLVLPPTLALPTGVGYWLGLPTPAAEPAVKAPEPLSVPLEYALPATAPALPAPPARTSSGIAPVADTLSETGAALAPAAEPGPALTPQAVVFVLWLVGLLVFGLLLVQRALFVRGLVAQSVPGGEGLQEKLQRYAQQVGARGDVQIRISPNTFSPAVCGLLHPTILVPASLLRKLSADNLRAVLIHELAHIKRGDLGMNFIQTILQVAYFYNPLVWLAHALVRKVREQAVDEMVLVALGAEAKSYSRTLIDIAEMTFFKANLALRLIGVAESKRSLEGRIKHMLTRPIPTSARVGFWGAAALLVVAAVLLPMAQGQSVRGSDRVLAAHLPDGVTVELLGVCNWPDDGRRCWSADGGEMSAERYATKENAPPLAGRYGFMLKITGPDGLNVSWSDVEGASNWQGSCEVVDARGRLLEDGTGVISNMEAGKLQTSLRVGVAAGAWRTISSHDGRRSASRSGVLWSQAREGADGTEIVTATEPNEGQAERVVAVDLDGTVHAGWYGFVSLRRTGSIRQCTARFSGLRISQIKEFQFQVRPYQWARFEDISLRPGYETNVTVETDTLNGEADEEDAFGSTTSLALGERLSLLGRALLIYANDHDDRFPDDLSDLDWSEAGDLSLSWVQANVVYLGRGVTTRDRPDRPLAFDKTLLSQGQGTNVLFLDSHVAFVKPIGLDELGIEMGRVDRVVALDRLKKLALAVLLYANEDQANRLPDSINAAGRYLDDETLTVWLQINAEYLGRGMRSTERQPARRPLAYIKTGPIATEGTSVVFLDGHAEFVRPSELRVLGIATTQDRDVSTVDPTQAVARIQSATRLSDLWRPLLFYASEHGERLPDDLAEIRQDVRSMYSWLLENVTYMGKGLTTQGSLTRPLAYDKTLLAKGVGTNVLYLNGRVEFETVERLSELGIEVTDERAISHRMLSGSGRAMLVYASDHDDRFPDEFADLVEVDMLPTTVSWLEANVVYLGRGVTTADRPDRPLAYDKTLLTKGGGTNVLYLDSHVAFETPKRLEELGIEPEASSRVQAVNYLRQLAIAAHMYADEHRGVLPDDLAALRPYLSDSTAFVWLRANATYLGQGATLQDPDPARKPLAYWMAGPVSWDDVVIVFVDGHVEITDGQQLNILGVNAPVLVQQPTARLSASQAVNRIGSARRMAELGKALLIYVNDHDDQLPETLEDVTPYIDESGDLAWMSENVAYRGRYVDMHEPPTTVVAYDKTLLTRDQGTNVLCLDAHVEFQTPEQILEELKSGPEATGRWLAMSYLQAMAKAAYMYADAHEGMFPDDLESLEPYVGDGGVFAWIRANVEYLGQGLSPSDVDPVKTPLAYWKTGHMAEGLTAVVFVDAHGEFAMPARLEEIGLDVSGEAGASDETDELPNIFVMSPSRDDLRLFNAVVSKTEAWTHNKTGRVGSKAAYDELFNGTQNRTDHDVLVLLIAGDQPERVPAEYVDMLPCPRWWIEATLQAGGRIVTHSRQRGMYVLLLAAPDTEGLMQAVDTSRFLSDPDLLMETK